MDSILTSIKKLLGVTEEYKHFDVDIIIAINTVFSTLNQLGVGPIGGFSIQDELANWSDYIPDNEARLELVKTYMHLRVRLIFDPPTSSSVMESYNRIISELEWRITVMVDEIEKVEVNEDEY